VRGQTGLGNESKVHLKASANSKGAPVSPWIAQLVGGKTATEWPEELRRLAGA
jgi:hypothetical protein